MGLMHYGPAKGSIPQKLNVTLRDEVPHQTLIGEIKARDAFVTDPAATNALKVAKDWADSGYGAHGQTKTPEVVFFTNKPYRSLQIIGIEERGEGGRVWKVFLQSGMYDCNSDDLWIVDLREDVFLDALKSKCEIHDDGEGGLVIENDFRWVKLGSQMRLALMDSDLYREIEAYAGKQKEPKKPTLKPSTLEVGGLYLDLRGGGDYREATCFLGKVRYGGKPGFATCNIGCVEAPDWAIPKDWNLQQILDEDIVAVKLRRDLKFTTKVGQLSVEAFKSRLQKGPTMPLQFTSALWERHYAEEIEWI